MTAENFETIPVLDHPQQQVLTVVWSSDDAYVAPMCVAMASLLKTLSPDIFCDIVVLDNGISEENRLRITGGIKDSARATIRFCSVAHMLEGVPGNFHISQAAYQRLFIPFLFRTHQHVLYLDCDIIVQQDLSQLLDVEFDGEYVAAVRDIGMAENTHGRAPMRYQGRHTNWRVYAHRVLGLSENDIEESFNSGVMLFNIPAFIADDFAALRDLERHIRAEYFLVDQCVANILFRGRVKHLHLRWNFQVQNGGAPRLVDWFLAQYHEAKSDPVILHYITDRKPWRSVQVSHEDAFWAIARETDWCHQLQESRLTNGFLPWLNRSEGMASPAKPEDPFFSIIMPVYNREQLVEHSIRSLQLQGFSNFELIVIDDASTDRTVDCIRRLAATDGRIQWVQLKVNSGPAIARNVGIERARGVYVGICDSDDYYAPGALSIFARHLRERPVDVMAGNQTCWVSQLQTVEVDRGPSRIDRDICATELRELPEFWTLAHFHRCMIRRQFLQDNRIEYPPLRRVEDPAYLAEVLTRAQTFMLVKDPVYLFHVRPRTQEWTHEEILHAYRGYERIRHHMSDAGYADLAFFFHCFYSPLWLSYQGVSREDALDLAGRLIDLLAPLSSSVLEHPYLMHPDFDSIGFAHDLMVVKNSTPEQIVELMQRGMFCAVAHVKETELCRLRDRVLELNNTLGRLRVVHCILRLGKRILERLYREIHDRFRCVSRWGRGRSADRFFEWKRSADG